MFYLEEKILPSVLFVPKKILNAITRTEQFQTI